MAIGDPIQWIIIGVVVIALFLWGPQKIPDLAKALGQARKEFDQASKEMNAAMTMTPSPVTAPAKTYVQSTPAEMTGDQTLIETARKLGITTEGKTREQISQEIVDKVQGQQ